MFFWSAIERCMINSGKEFCHHPVVYEVCVRAMCMCVWECCVIASLLFDQYIWTRDIYNDYRIDRDSHDTKKWINGNNNNKTETEWETKSHLCLLATFGLRSTDSPSLRCWFVVVLLGTPERGNILFQFISVNLFTEMNFTLSSFFLILFFAELFSFVLQK